ncbi:MAG: Molybdenum cofactor biosynthesis protein [Mycobacterium sp.]|jgi:hypothetical protein|nr:Molybdenum cofactor biosynthesis protein [Mycobacterium sp.]
MNTADRGYIPQDEWPAVTTMLDGFGEPSLPTSTSLEGADIEIGFENGWEITHRFDAGHVTWTITAGEGVGATGTHPYRAVEVHPGIFFVDFVKGDGVGSSDVSMVMDRNNGKVTVADSSFVDRDGAIRMRTDVISGRLAGTGAIEALQPSKELVGKRIYYRYSPTEHYEHIYLNVGTFVWHCVKGGEAGLADTDPIQVFELADGIVILHWSETVMPVESILVVDLHNQRTIGRMFCWDGPTLAPVHLPFDSRFTVLNDTSYPTD